MKLIMSLCIGVLLCSPAAAGNLGAAECPTDGSLLVVEGCPRPDPVLMPYPGGARQNGQRKSRPLARCR